MKVSYLLLLPLFAAVVTFDAATASAARLTRKASLARARAVCSQVRNVTGREFLYKSEISGHISRGDPRASGPTLICNRICPTRFPASVYYSDGTYAAKLGYYGRWSQTGKTRAYCATGGAPACSNAVLSRGARAGRRNGWLYLQTDAARGICYRVRPVGRTGSPT